MLPATWWYFVQVLDMQPDLYLDEMQELPLTCVWNTISINSKQLKDLFAEAE